MLPRCSRGCRLVDYGLRDQVMGAAVWGRPEFRTLNFAR